MRPLYLISSQLCGLLETLPRVVVKALGQIGIDAVPYLITALEDRSEYIREAAAEALCQLAMPLFLTLLPPCNIYKIRRAFGNSYCTGKDW